MNFMSKLERKLGRYAIRNLSLVLILCYVAGYIIEYTNSGFFSYLTLDPTAIIRGQVWRIVSWLLIPPPESNLFFAIIMLMFYYSIGNTLERAWGAFQYNLYIFMGMIFTVIGSFALMGYCYWQYPNGVLWVSSSGTVSLTVQQLVSSLSLFFSTYYVNMSIFLAFAATFPNNQVLLMFIIPVKVKWLGIVYGVFLAYEMISGMLGSSMGFVYPFVIGSSLLNFLLFFFTTRVYIMKGRKKTKAQKAYRAQTRNFEKERKNTYAYTGITKHKCAVCGRTERDGDDLVFRFCSKCEGNYEYCQDHLYTHIHYTNDRNSQ